MQFLFGAISTIVLGALGWLVLEFVGRPIRSFLDLRREVRHELLRLADVEPPRGDLFLMSHEEQRQDEQRFASVQNSIRALGARMMAFGETEWPANKLIALAGFDAVEAGRSIVRLAAQYADDDARDKHREQVARFLKYPF